MYLLIFYQALLRHLSRLDAVSAFYMLYSPSAVIKFRAPDLVTGPPSLVTGAAKTHTVPGLPVLHFNHCGSVSM